jgi:ribulose-5-phosphate 4-epimerase/fuculose-1-phosphate aldolase
MSHERERRAIVDAGRWLSNRGLAPGSSGNISLRLGDEWLMTPTGTPLGRLDGARLSRLDGSGGQADGDPPTKERPLHLAVYEARPPTGAVVHLHSTWAVALACLQDLESRPALAPLTPYQVMRVHPIGIVPYARPGSAELAQLVRARAQDHAVLLLANHGPVVAAATLDEAVFAVEELEEVAKLHFLLDGRAARELSPAEVDDIRRHLKR